MKTKKLFLLALSIVLGQSKLYAKSELCSAHDTHTSIEHIAQSNNIIGMQNTLITNSSGQVLRYQQGDGFAPGTRIKSYATRVIIRTEAGQTITLAPNSEIKIVSENKDIKNKNCLTTFELLEGKATFEGEHAGLKSCLGANYINTAELVGSDIDIMPTGTKYSVDMNQVVAELNGETQDENSKITVTKPFKPKTIQVEKGSIAIKLKKYKPSKSASYVDEVYNDETVFVKSRSKVKTKKGKKDRVADIEVVYPQD